MEFVLSAQDPDTGARSGSLTLPHGTVPTPAFMPVGTNGAIKALHHSKVAEIGYGLILANTYHLYLRPGVEVIRHYKGLHRFTNWKGNILTDSGGYQVFSLNSFRKITEEGVRFRSHIDGSYHMMTPELCISLQQLLGSDIAMPLDVCTPPETDYNEARDAMELTLRWAKRSYLEWSRGEPQGGSVSFAITQGNFYESLRRESILRTIELAPPGIALGGLSVGEPYSLFRDTLAAASEHLPVELPRYLMGIGTPEYILCAVENGIDIFDCVLPSRIARNGAAFTTKGVIHLKKAPFVLDDEPIEQECPCHACKNYSRGYIHHLIKAREMLGPMLLTEHNLTFLFRFMGRIRDSIANSRFREFKAEFLSGYASSARIMVEQ